VVIPVGDLIAYLSSILELLPGDVVFTGTPSGVGMSRTSPHYLSPADQLESWIERIGSMSHTFIGLYADQSAAEPKPLTEEGG
jgi:2,4-didehydro-3-deoxy-L-rhamnonate hydrolase